MRRILIIRCGVQIEIAQRLGTICISLVRLLDIAIVVQEIQRTVALRTEVAPLPLQFSDEVLAVAVEELIGAIRATSHRHIRQQLCLLIHTGHQL